MMLSLLGFYGSTRDRSSLRKGRSKVTSVVSVTVAQRLANPMAPGRIPPKYG